jgi:hypothetical protein
MSNEPEFVSAVGAAVGSSRAAAVPAATFVPTARHIDGSDECWSQVQAWAQLENHARIVSHGLNHALAVALASAQLFRGVELTCFRGLAFPEGCVPGPNKMGPPPEGSTVATGRYNHDAQPVLYLSHSVQGVAREVEPGPNIWVQSYTLKLDGLRVADFRPPVETLLNHVFWWTETASEDRGTGFRFSQFVAGRVAESFDGMIVPGVRGDESTRYDNIVVFRPDDRWRGWLTEGSNPQPLRP